MIAKALSLRAYSAQKNKARQTTRFVSRIHRLLAATCANHFHDLALFRIDDTYRTEECDKCN